MRRQIAVSILWLCLAWLGGLQMSLAGPWIAPDWRDHEPTFPPGSLFWKTKQYPTCPVLFRTVVDVGAEHVAFAGFRAHAQAYAYVLLNGRQIAGYIRPEGEETDRPFDVELTHLLRPGPNVLIVSTGAGG
ncbi:MAG: hypothetical protein PVH68_17980, partial [Armatimonadota bacterium]